MWYAGPYIAEILYSSFPKMPGIPGAECGIPPLSAHWWGSIFQRQIHPHFYLLPDRSDPETHPYWESSDKFGMNWTYFKENGPIAETYTQEKDREK